MYIRPFTAREQFNIECNASLRQDIAYANFLDKAKIAQQKENAYYESVRNGGQIDWSRVNKAMGKV